MDVKAVAVDGESPAISNPEVEVRATRRRFAEKFKRRILREAEGCKGSGEIGALLRREGLYASHLVTWRRQLESDGTAGLSRKRGRKVDPEAGSTRKIAQLERANQRLVEKLRKAEFIIEFQKKMAILWGSPNPDGSEEQG